jgi:hypothetical protein
MMREKVGDVVLMTLVQGLHMLLLAGAGGEFEDFHRRLEVVLQGVPEGMWMQIQDEGVLEQCVGLPVELRTLIHRAAVAGVAMTG